VPEAHTCNPSYSGGRRQEDCVSKPTPGNSLRDPISKTPSTKKDWHLPSKREALKFNPPLQKKDW
jgi:hypothetical protein